ncbi:MAG: hydrogenase maturation protein HypF [Kribbellaceae bacterium]|nr:hydrogenase maturation protein HypF [Kribbellaceae bacterium]
MTFVADEEMPARGGTAFVLQNSTAGAGRRLVPPDVATCNDCLAEFADPATITAGLRLCPDCSAGYPNPGDRRVPAQPS